MILISDHKDLEVAQSEPLYQSNVGKILVTKQRQKLSHIAFSFLHGIQFDVTAGCSV